MAFKETDIASFKHETFRWTNCVFWQEEIIQAYGNNLKFFLHYNGKECNGAFVAYEAVILGRKALITPPFWPNIGPLIRPMDGKTVNRITRAKSIITAWITFLDASAYSRVELSIPVDVVDLQPAIWAGWEVHVRYTYRLNLKISETELFGGYEDKLKTILRNCENAALVSNQVPIEVNAAKLIGKGLEEKNALAHRVIFEGVLSSVSPENGAVSRVCIADDCIAESLYLISEGVAYYLFGGTNSTGKKLSAGHLSLHNAILDAKRRGCEVFDFEGSMMPGVERYFRQFGGEICPYFVVSKGMTTYKWLRKAIGKNRV